MPNGFEQIIHSNEGQELKSNWKEFEKTDFFVGEVKAGVIASFDISEARYMRKTGNVLTPISVDLKKEVDSVAEVPNSIMACGSCERMSDEEIKTNGIAQGTIRVGYTDGSKIMLCKKHFDPEKENIKLHEIPDVIGVNDGEDLEGLKVPEAPKEMLGIIKDKRTGKEIDITEQWHKYTD